MYTQTLTKKISLPKNWKDNNYEGYAKYVQSATNVSKVLSALLVSDKVEVVSLEYDITVNLRAVQEEPQEKLDDSFWVDVATGNYIESP